MKKLAVVIGIVFAIADMALAHPHPRPHTCLEWCKDDNCRCFETCEAAGNFRGSDCHKKCAAINEECERSCNGTGT